MKNKNGFRPYIDANKVVPEFTFTSVILGIVLAVVFGAANAYLGLRVGMTVSASIPVAVISMGILRVILKKDSILENNMVQTIGSAGESLAAGYIYNAGTLYVGRGRKVRYAIFLHYIGNCHMRRRIGSFSHGAIKNGIDC